MTPESKAKLEEMELLDRAVRFWVSKVFCPYKAPELRYELALEGFQEFYSILNPPKDEAEK